MAKKRMLDPSLLMFEEYRSRNGKYKKVWNRRQLKCLKRLYTNGLSIRECARLFGVSLNCIKAEIHRLDIRRPKSQWVKCQTSGEWREILSLDKTQLKKLYVGRMWSTTKIAKHFSVSEEYIRRLIVKYGWIRSNQEAQKLRGERQRRREAGRILRQPVSQMSYHDYRHFVYKLTNYVYQDYKELLDPDGLRGRHHLDHRVTVYNGYFKYSKIVPLSVMCHPANLQILTRRSNIIKGSTNSVKLKQLKLDIQNFEKENWEVFSNG